MVSDTKKLLKFLKIEAPMLPVSKRIDNFDEVAIGYSDEEAQQEASRCLQCKKPKCVQGCPACVKIPEFINQIVLKDYIQAYKYIRETNNFPGICGRVCPQEKQCEGICILQAKKAPIAIGRLERYVFEQVVQLEYTPSLGLIKEVLPVSATKKPVACIGSGPASLALAGQLAVQGIPVTIFEQLDLLGGVLIQSIPEFRLPRHIVDFEINALRELGVTFHTQWKDFHSNTINELFMKGYYAVFIGIGASIPGQLGVPGETSKGIFKAHDYLAKVKRLYHANPLCEELEQYKGQHVTIFGAGNVAMDASRTAIRLGAKSVRIMYRRTHKEMPAREEEIKLAEEEGITFMELVSPIQFKCKENNHVSSVLLQKMDLSSVDGSGRQGVVPIEGDILEYATDLVIVAVGSHTNSGVLASIPGLEVTDSGYIKVNQVGETTIPNVFSGGDVVTSPANVIMAVKAGRTVAHEIIRRLGA